MYKDNLIREKLKKVCDYGKKIQGQTFAPSFQYERNEMAKAVIFQIKWMEFMEFTEECHDVWTNEEVDRGIDLLDFIIKVCESSSDTWELFWQGKQPMNPKRMPFRNLKENKIDYVDLTQVEKIEMPFLGIR